MGKPDSANTPNQDTFTDTQNFDVDIDKLYNDWIVQIDNIRSFASINVQSAALLKSLQISKEVSKLIKPEKTVQESRCHAFYRWVGFPVRGNGKIYNPGSDITDKRTITDDQKNSIASNPLPDFNKLSEQRETFSQQNLEIFSLPGSTNSGCLALSSGGVDTLRKFVVPFDQDDTPFDMVVDHQSFEFDPKVRMGKTFTTLDKFKNSNGDTFNGPESSKKVSTKRLHIIKPFLVDARIDFSVSPQSRLITVPFVKVKDHTKVDEVNFIKRPLLENIIINRFSVDDPTINAGTFTNRVLQIISQFPDIKDNELVQKASDPAKSLLKQSEQIQLGDSINTIKSLMGKLVAAQKIIQKAQGLYYWLPSPSVSGPEGGSTVQGVFVPTVIGKELVTETDSKIFFAQLRDAVNRVTRTGNAATGEPTAGEFGLQAQKITFGPDTTSAMGDNNATNLETLTTARYNTLTEASDALRTIEIIMGDFSGFGLCDIVAIIGSLNVIPKENLVAFLDDDAKTRMFDKLKLKSGDVAVPDFEAASKVLATSVKEFYNLMDKIYEDILNRGATA